MTTALEGNNITTNVTTEARSAIISLLWLMISGIVMPLNQPFRKYRSVDSPANE